MQDKGIAEILTKAADVIEARGWTQGSYVGPLEVGQNINDGPVCALGAINIAAGFPPGGSPDERTSVAGPAERAAVALIAHLDGMYVDTWNDRLGRTAEQVVTALRQCAAELAGTAS